MTKLHRHQIPPNFEYARDDRLRSFVRSFIIKTKVRPRFSDIPPPPPLPTLHQRVLRPGPCERQQQNRREDTHPVIQQ